jgi:hypothetical protein
VNELARFVVEAARLPLRLTEVALQSQAQAIDDWVARGAVPPLLVPGAAVLKVQIGFLIGMIRSVSGSDPSGPADAGGTRGRRGDASGPSR